MNLFLQLIFCGLLADSAFSILDTPTKTKRHIWRGTPNAQTVEEPRYIQTKGGRSNPAALHRQHPTLTVECALHENGIKSHPYSCRMYVNCVDGEISVDSCSEGFLFNAATKECDFAAKVTCSVASTQSARLYSPQPEATSGQSARLYNSQQNSYRDRYRDTSHYTDTDREVISHFKCPHEGLFEHPHDCTKFIQCAHAGLFVQSCGPGTMFNPSLLVCDWPKNVNCNKNVNANIESATNSQNTEIPANQQGQKTRPVDADYEFDFDVRMSDTNAQRVGNNNNNNDQQHRVYSTSGIQSEHSHTRSGQRPNPQYSSPQTPQTSSQYAPTRSLQPPSQTSSDVTPTHQPGVYPVASQGRAYQSPPQGGLPTPSRTTVQHPPQTSPQYTPSRTLQTPLQTYPQQSPDLSFTQQQEAAFPATSQSRSFQPEPTRDENFGILTSVQPLANPRTQPNGNSVHSSPSYTKTKIYSSQQNNAPHSSFNPTPPSHQYSHPNQDGEGADRRPPVSRQYPSNGQPETFDQTMDMLDTYANYQPARRLLETQNGRANVMTVDRVSSNRDHEIPIYNRPERPRFTSRSSDDQQTQGTERALPVNDALKLMLSPYAKNGALKNDDVGEMATKILSNVDTVVDEAATNDAVVTEEPIRSFDINIPQYDEPHNLYAPTPTPDSETLVQSSNQGETKIGRFPPRTNSLLNGDQNRKSSNGGRLSYRGEQIELFCTTGFDCGNGVCLSSQKICDGRDDCGNRLDETNCKHIRYDVRLSGDGERQNMGRIEVQVFDRWGHICGDGIGINEANVFCREAGFPLGAVEVKTNYNSQSQVSSTVDDSTNYALHELRCGGNESSLKQCQFNGWNVRDCSSEETVAVVCKLPDMKCQLNYWLCDQSEECVPTAFLCDAVRDCSDGSDESDYHCNSTIQYRLGNQRSNHKEGRVEVRYKGIWGTVCDDDFGENEAKVFCRSLGYDGAAAVIKEFAQPGHGLIWLDQVSCIGNETSLENCGHFEWGENNCNHTEDVSVRCFEQEVDTYQKLTLRDPTISSPHLNEIHRTGKSSGPDSDHCGQIRVADNSDEYDDQPVFKVIEGREAKRGHHPWQATLRVRGRNGKSSHWCGAVLISKTHVLTAAHCLIGFTKNAYFIRLGDHHSETPEDTEVEIFIEDWHIHEKFRRGHLMNNDIAIIKLKSAVKFTDHIQPICLPTEETEYTVGKNCTISGWGSTQYGKSTPSLQLRSASIPIMSEEICREAHNYGTSIQSGMFCAGIPGNMIDACDGDSGGPFVCRENEENGYHSLYGIISWGQRCGDQTKPGVYTKVAEYLSWIQEKMLL